MFFSDSGDTVCCVKEPYWFWPTVSSFGPIRLSDSHRMMTANGVVILKIQSGGCLP
jgi:hypothetical protein